MKNQHQVNMSDGAPKYKDAQSAHDRYDPNAGAAVFFRYPQHIDDPHMAAFVAGLCNFSHLSMLFSFEGRVASLVEGGCASNSQSTSRMNISNEQESP
ncbi:hypothetical protein BN1723_015118 [Verticillium longisporum]|uniref:Uncharacterized protein n=1 Tax=Verticillium longisporum TaxID=100787 RepID=A0A0G4MRI3_VERLO|nr:hypothetical protein BN1723_015118 [Verticillium longisporum]